MCACTAMNDIMILHMYMYVLCITLYVYVCFYKDCAHVHVYVLCVHVLL